MCIRNTVFIIPLNVFLGDVRVETILLSTFSKLVIPLGKLKRYLFISNL